MYRKLILIFYSIILFGLARPAEEGDIDYYGSLVAQEGRVAVVGEEGLVLLAIELVHVSPLLLELAEHLLLGGPGTPVLHGHQARSAEVIQEFLVLLADLVTFFLLGVQVAHDVVKEPSLAILDLELGVEVIFELHPPRARLPAAPIFVVTVLPLRIFRDR